MARTPVIIIGSGPAALLAADILSERQIPCHIFEKRASPAWRLLVAGSSGLNITYDAPLDTFASFYRKGSAEIKACLQKFTPQDWLSHLHGLGEETYLGTSHRFFLKEMKAANLLRLWLDRLHKRGVVFTFNAELLELRAEDKIYELGFSSGQKIKAEHIVLAMGGGSWQEKVPTWPQILKAHDIEVEEFAPANAGFHIEAKQDFFEQAAGKPIKGLILHTALGSKQGELMITRYGLEGAPVYYVGCTGDAILDLKPELAEARLSERMRSGRGNVWQRIESQAKLSEGALLLLRHLAAPAAFSDVEAAAKLIKNFPLRFTQSRPLQESISSSGGLAWSELSSCLELKKLPNVYCVGEMVDWDAPTGGFLLQACVSMAAVAARRIATQF